MSNKKKSTKPTRKTPTRTTPVKLAMAVARAQKSYMEFGARERRHEAELEKARSGKAKAHKEWQAAVNEIQAPPDLKLDDVKEALTELATHPRGADRGVVEALADEESDAT